MTFVIAGYGFVGQAYYSVFKDCRALEIVDPKYNQFCIKDFEKLEGVVCCVSTPSDSSGFCDISSVISVIADTPETVPILIKSTIDIAGWKKIKNLYSNHKITFSPEFLKAATAAQDLASTEQVILADGDLDFWFDFYLSRFKSISVRFADAEEAISAKYFVNSFLATKVSFFNQIYDFCKAYNLDYEHVRRLIELDERIGSTHTQITTERGWGGHCFPKDTAALLKMAKEKSINLSVLESSVEYNSQIRKVN